MKQHPFVTSFVPAMELQQGQLSVLLVTCYFDQMLICIPYPDIHLFITIIIL